MAHPSPGRPAPVLWFPPKGMSAEWLTISPSWDRLVPNWPFRGIVVLRVVMSHN